MGDETDSKKAVLTDLGESLDITTFDQILEMDEPDDTEFSSSIVFGFFDQAEETLDAMDESLANKDLEKLASHGHFLKGSSATLGLVIMRDACERIQRLGHKEDETGTEDRDQEYCLKAIAGECKVLRTEYDRVEKALKSYFKE